MLRFRGFNPSTKRWWWVSEDELGGGGEGGSGAILSTTVEISSAEILALFDTPKVLVPAQGEDSRVIVLGTLTTSGEGTTPYSGEIIIAANSPQYSNPSIKQVFAGGPNLSSYGGFGSLAFDADIGVGEPFRIKAEGANPVDGDFGVTIVTLYTVV